MKIIRFGQKFNYIHFALRYLTFVWNCHYITYTYCVCGEMHCYRFANGKE